MVKPYILAAELLKDRVTGKNTHLFFPEYIDARLKEAKEVKDKNAPHWHEKRRVTMSMCVRGMSKQGNPIIAFVHEPHYLMVPENLVLVPDSMVVPDKGSYTTASLPDEEWEKTLKREGNGKIFVADYKEYEKIIRKSLDEYEEDIRRLGTREEVENNPVIYGLFGGDKERCRKYLRLKRPNKDLHLWLGSAVFEDCQLATLISLGIDYHEGKSGGWDSYFHESNYSPSYYSDGPIREETLDGYL